MSKIVANDVIYEVLNDVRGNQYRTQRTISFIEDELKSHRAHAHAMQQDINHIQSKLRDIETKLDRVRVRLGPIHPEH